MESSHIVFYAVLRIDRGFWEECLVIGHGKMALKCKCYLLPVMGLLITFVGWGLSLEIFGLMNYNPLRTCYSDRLTMEYPECSMAYSLNIWSQWSTSSNEDGSTSCLHCWTHGTCASLTPTVSTVVVGFGKGWMVEDGFFGFSHSNPARVFEWSPAWWTHTEIWCDACWHGTCNVLPITPVFFDAEESLKRVWNDDYHMGTSQKGSKG